jgi:hypothetical protein
MAGTKLIASQQNEMTDEEAISRVCFAIDPGTTGLHVIRRNGRVLLGLSSAAIPALFALGLYQPQRPSARAMVTGVKCLVHLGLHRRLLARVSEAVPERLALPWRADAGSCGVLLGSPEHRVRRAVASYRINGDWEVAKVAFGSEGGAILTREAEIMARLTNRVEEMPGFRGVHEAGGMTFLRMQRVQGTPLRAGESMEALALLRTWESDDPLKSIEEFSEWPAIEAALLERAGGDQALAALKGSRFKPVIRHGDFARWNLLRRSDGGLVVLDWEWGHEAGMPGIDLVHYFLQDARLVKKLPAVSAVRSVIEVLRGPECSAYLERTGWGGRPLLAIIACLAYKQGAGHQDNSDAINGALECLMRSGFPI